MIYKVEFELSEPLAREEMTDTISTDKMPKKSPSKKGFIEQKTAKPIMFAYTVAQTGRAIVNTQALNDMTLRGDTLAAKMKQEKMARNDKLFNMGINVAMGLAIKGTLGAAFLAAQALKLATDAVSVAMENQNLIRRTQQEKYINSQEQTRFVRNATTESIRW